MNVIKPITMTDSMLVSSTISEPGSGETAWSSLTTYSLGDTVSIISANSHKTYESLDNSNTNNPPATSAKWEYTGYTNRWKMFDETRNAKSVGNSPMTIVVQPGQRISAFALIGMEADYLEVSISEGGVEKYTYSENLLKREVLNWYDFFFEPFSSKPAVAKFDVPPLADPVITITLTSTSGIVSLGRFAFGMHTYIGKFLLDGASMPSVNYSTVDRDEFGNAVLTPRVDIPTIRGNLHIEARRLNKVRDIFKDLNGRVAIWAGVDQSDHPYFDISLINGFVREKTPSPVTDKYVRIGLEIEEI